MKNYPRNSDSTQLFLRTVLVILLSSKPYCVKEGFLFNAFFLKPEDQPIVNLKAIYSMLVSTEKADIENCIGLMTLMRRYKDAGHLAAFVKNCVFTSAQDILQFKFTSCLLYSFCLQEGASCIATELESYQIDDLQ